jgi:single-strand DNA-binding protein
MARGSVNKAIILGNLGADPEIRTTSGGQNVANFRIATNRTFTDRSGQRQEQTEWHNIVVWGRLAEIAEQYLKKGDSVFIEGRIQTRSWEDQSGQQRWTTEIVAQEMTMLGGAGGGQGGGGGGSRRGSRPAPEEETGPEAVSEGEDDVPF